MPVHNLPMPRGAHLSDDFPAGRLEACLRFGREHGMGAGVETEREDQQLNAEQQAAQRDAPIPPGRPCEKEQPSISQPIAAV